MARVRQAAGGGRVVEVAADRIPGWMTRFAANHGGLTSLAANTATVRAEAKDGATAVISVPFAPMDPGEREPVEALLAHLAGLGDLAAVLVRERAFSVGICRQGVVTASSTDTRYVQSRTAAGGWSQQRYARRRGNQRRDSYQAAADAAVRVFADHPAPFDGLIVGGDRSGIEAVLADPRLARLGGLPRRAFPDAAEPRRAVLDEIAERSLTALVTVTDPPASGPAEAG